MYPNTFDIQGMINKRPDWARSA